MKVLCTGPESSGTKLLTRIVQTGADGEHRSMPHDNEWWDPKQVPHDCAVVIVRDGRWTAESAWDMPHCGSVDEALFRREMALRRLGELQVPVLWVGYEGLVAAPHAQVQVIGAWLGASLDVPEIVYDANEVRRSG